MTELANTINESNTFSLIPPFCYMALIPRISSLLFFGHRFLIFSIFEFMVLNLLFKISKYLMIIP